MSPLRALPALSHGDHACLFYRSPEEHGVVTASFLGLGLERDERCVYVGGADSIESVREGLKSAGVAVASEEDKGRLILTDRRDYLEGGRWSTEKMLGFLQDAYESTMADGRTALRAAGDVSWQVGPSGDFSEVVHYEALLDLFFAGKRMVGMCQYPQDRCPSDTLLGILRTHRVAAVGTELCDNPHYVPPGILIEKDEGARERQRVEWLMSQLVRVRKAEEDRDRLQKELLLSQKREAIGRLASGVAHDFNNVLTAILGLSDLIVNEPSAGSAAVRDAREIRLAGERATALTRQLLSLGRARGDRETVVDPGDVVQAMTAFLRRILPENVRLETRTAAGLGGVRADIGRLEQVLMNLAVNARDAMPDGGTIVVETAPAGPDAVLSVTDDGAGIPADVLPRVFEPFFTTKGEGKGTGLGLATVREIVERAGGRVEVESVAGKGTTFRVLLPRSAQAPEPLGARTPAQEAPLRGTETVLVVEDEAYIRSLVRRVLSGHGYSVLEAGGPAEALRLARENAGALKALVMDMSLPKANGRELAARLAEVRPGVRTLFVSGYSEAEAAPPAGAAFLQKPFAPEALLRAVRALLDS